MMPRALLTDVGGVLVTAGPRGDRVAQHLGLPTSEAGAAKALQALWAHRGPYDLGLDDAAYWRRVAAEAGVEPPSAAALEALLRDDVERWSNPRPTMVAMLERLHARGVRLGVLSNAPARCAEVLRGLAWVKRLDAACTFSCDVGMVKPAPEIYAAACRAVGAAPEETVFIDDLQVNIDAANAAGLRGVLWEGAEEPQAITQLEALFDVR